MARLTFSRKALMVAGVAFSLAASQTVTAESTGTDGSVLDIRPEDVPAACTTDHPQIRVTAVGQTEIGILTVELYNDDTKHFLAKEGRLRRVRIPARGEPQLICFDFPGAGTYAIAAYHDINANRALDKKWNRLPKEPFALSNDPKLKLRKPRHYEAAFEAPAEGLDIDLKVYKR